MVVAAYHPRWIQVQSGDRRITALTFVVRRDHVQYARLSHEEETVVIAEACGAFGSSCDYLMRTRAALASHGIVDRYLEQLARDVQRRQLACAAPVVGDVK
jgi:cation transport protein ChaC